MGTLTPYQSAALLPGKLIWATDWHLNHAGAAARQRLLAAVRTELPGTLLLTGDISTGRQLPEDLHWLAAELDCPIAFILGNHDFYGSGFARVDAVVPLVCADYPRLLHLDGDEVLPLSCETALVGHRGWADGRAGAGADSCVELNDYHLITDLSGLSKAERFRRLAALGDASAKRLRQVLALAVPRFQSVFVATHVPPFPEATWHLGRTSDAEFLPHFCNTAAGKVLRGVAAKHPRHRFTVLCGHTHSSGEAQILPNLVVHTGGAEYGSPRIQRCFCL
jgi:predicted phosphohydrolase